MLTQVVNVALIVGAIIIGRRIYFGIKNSMNASGTKNMFDVDNKKI